MPSWRVSNNVLAEDIEDQAVALARDTSGVPVEVTLHDMKRLRVSASARLLGFLAWIRGSGRATILRIHTGQPGPGLPEDSRYWKFFSNELAGIILSTYAFEIRKQDDSDVRPDLLDMQKKVHRDLSGEIKSGSGIAAFIRDEMPLIGPPSLLRPMVDDNEDDDPFLQFRQSLGEVTRSINLEEIGTEHFNELATFVWEVFRNTEVHGSLGGGPPVTGIRFFELRRFNLSDLSDVELASPEDTSLFEYLAHVREQGKARSVVELTIADSGPGIAATMAGTMAVYLQSFAAEIILTERAFTREGTSRGRTDPDAGGGLVDALDACRKLDGFLSVRTGRTQLHRHYSPGAPAGDLLTFREDRHLPWVRGTSVSLLVPWVGAER